MNGKKCKLLRKLTGVSKSELLPIKMFKGRLEYPEGAYVKYKQFKRTSKGKELTRDLLR